MINEMEWKAEYPAQLGLPEDEDCVSSIIPNNIDAVEQGKKKLIVADPVSMTKFFFDHYRLPMYSFLNASLKNGKLSKLIGRRIQNTVINRKVCSFPSVTFWRIDRESFYADVSVELKLNTAEGEVLWKGYITHVCYFEDEFFTRIDDLTCEVDRESEDCVLLSPFLVPYFTSHQMDDVTEKMWTEYMSDSERDAEKLATEMGLKVQYYNIFEHHNVEGIIYFVEDELVVGDDYYATDDYGDKYLVKTNMPEKVTIPAGTIVVNTNKIKRDYSQFNIYHECIHYEFHYLYYRLQQLCSNDPRKMKTKEVIVDEDQAVSDPIYFMEKQANRGAYGLMMPASDTHKNIAEEAKKINSYKHSGEKYELIGKALAKKMSIPHFRVRCRMIQLGYLGAKGSLNYVNKKLIRPFAFDLDSWRESDFTFVIDDSTVRGICKRNNDFKKIIDSKIYVYAEGHIVQNNPRYVTNDGSKYILTEYANSHVDNCCLRFTRHYEQEYIGRFVYGRMYYDAHYVEKTEFFLNDEINGKQMDLLDAKDEYKKSFPTEFSKAFKMLMNKSGYTEESLAPLLSTTERTLREWIKAPETKITADFIIYVSLLWQLPDWISKMLLDDAFICINERAPRFRALEYIRTVMWDCGIDKANAFLTSRGFEPLQI